MKNWKIVIILCFWTVFEKGLSVNVSSNINLKDENSKKIFLKGRDVNDLHEAGDGNVLRKGFNQSAACKCGENANCHLDDKSVEICSCNPGYAMENGTCKPCNCEPGFNCSFGDGSGFSKVCYCPKGYVDYRENCAACNCGLEEANCSLSYGSMMSCACPKGYEEIRERATTYKSSCKDIDECVREKKPCEDPHAKCFNTPGSYLCDCRQGYLLRKVDVEKSNTCLEDSQSWRTATIVIGCMFGVIIIGLSMAIYSKRKFFCPNGHQYLFRYCQEFLLA